MFGELMKNDELKSNIKAILTQWYAVSNTPVSSSQLLEEEAKDESNTNSNFNEDRIRSTIMNYLGYPQVVHKTNALKTDDTNKNDENCVIS